MLSLKEILSKKEKIELKPTATVVRGPDGRVKVERKELLSLSEQEAKIAASEEAGRRRGEAKQKGDSGALAWKQSAVLGTPGRTDAPERIFPIRGGEVYEFHPDPNTNTDVDWEKGEWVVAPLHFRPGEYDSLPIGMRESIKVATFNIWFDNFEWKKRTEALLDLLVRDELTDVICLQEVTKKCLNMILQNKEIRKNYRVTDRGPTYRTIGGYGVTILVRRTLPVPDIDWVSLPTGMGRSGLVASFNVNNQGQKLAIATVHLESLGSKAIRAKQLNLLRTALRPYSAAVLLGDYNITATGPYGNPSENQDLYSILEDYDDLWLEEHGIDGDDDQSPNFLQSITYDSTGNAMIKAKKRKVGGKPENSRLDRAFVRASNVGDQKTSATIYAHSIERIGDDPIGPDLFISDHYGLAFKVTVMETGTRMIPKKQSTNIVNHWRKNSRRTVPPERPSKQSHAPVSSASLEGAKTNLFG